MRSALVDAVPTAQGPERVALWMVGLHGPRQLEGAQATERYFNSRPEEAADEGPVERQVVGDDDPAREEPTKFLAHLRPTGRMA